MNLRNITVWKIRPLLHCIPHDSINISKYFQITYYSFISIFCNFHMLAASFRRQNSPMHKLFWQRCHDKFAIKPQFIYSPIVSNTHLDVMSMRSISPMVGINGEARSGHCCLGVYPVTLADPRDWHTRVPIVWLFRELRYMELPYAIISSIII